MSEKDQIPPEGDNRYRTNKSVKCYVGELMCGASWCTWFFSNSIERVLYLFPGGIEKVVFKNKFYELQQPNKMQEIIINHLSDKGAVHIAGNSLGYSENDQSFKPYPFIDITSTNEYEKYNSLRPIWLLSQEFKNA